MQDNLATLITETARRERAHDFAWTVAISIGIVLTGVVFTSVNTAVPAWVMPVLALLAFWASLLIRFRYSEGRNWAEPVKRAVDAELTLNTAELSRLRLARGVAQALPEPLFILDDQGVIELANPAAEEFLSMQGLEGRHFAAVLRAPDVFEETQKNHRWRARPCCRLQYAERCFPVMPCICCAPIG